MWVGWLRPIVEEVSELVYSVRGGADTLAEAADFVGVGVVPYLVEIRVLSELPVF